MGDGKAVAEAGKSKCLPSPDLKLFALNTLMVASHQFLSIADLRRHHIFEKRIYTNQKYDTRL